MSWTDVPQYHVGILPATWPMLGSTFLQSPLLKTLARTPSAPGPQARNLGYLALLSSHPTNLPSVWVGFPPFLGFSTLVQHQNPLEGTSKNLLPRFHPEKLEGDSGWAGEAQ